MEVPDLVDMLAQEANKVTNLGTESHLVVFHPFVVVR